MLGSDSLWDVDHARAQCLELRQFHTCGYITVLPLIVNQYGVFPSEENFCPFIDRQFVLALHPNIAGQATGVALGEERALDSNGNNWPAQTYVEFEQGNPCQYARVEFISLWTPFGIWQAS